MCAYVKMCRISLDLVRLAGAIRRRPDSRGRSCRLVGCRLARAVRCRPGLQIKNVVRFESGWCISGPLGPAQTPKSKVLFGRGPAGFWAARGRTDSQSIMSMSSAVDCGCGPTGLGRPGPPRLPTSKMSLGRSPAGLGRPGPPRRPNRRCPLVGVRRVWAARGRPDSRHRRCRVVGVRLAWVALGAALRRPAGWPLRGL